MYEEDFVTGERWRLRTKGEIVAKLASNLSFQEVVDLARRYKVRYSDVVQELEKFRQKLFEEKQRKRSEQEILEDIYEADEFEEEFENESSKIIETITEFEPMGIVRDEKELRNQLASWLSAKLGKSVVKLEYPFEHGKVDILVKDEIAIEVKVADGKQKLKNLVGEVTTDKMYFSSVIAVIFDIGKDVGLEFFVNQLKALGATTIVIPAQIKRSGRRQEIIIRQGWKRIIIR
ncbi:hypothetical protein E3E31_03590 [Thermococcus sp. M39]|nr:hypothetical protein [Thermococcus sp. M39]